MKEALPYYGYNWKDLMAARTGLRALVRMGLGCTQRGIKNVQVTLFSEIK